MSKVFSKKRFVKVKNGMRVYDADHIEYWNKREYLNTQKRYTLNTQGYYLRNKMDCVRIVNLK